MSFVLNAAENVKVLGAVTLGFDRAVHYRRCRFKTERVGFADNARPLRRFYLHGADYVPNFVDEDLRARPLKCPQTRVDHHLNDLFCRNSAFIRAMPDLVGAHGVDVDARELVMHPADYLRIAPCVKIGIYPRKQADFGDVALFCQPNSLADLLLASKVCLRT